MAHSKRRADDAEAVPAAIAAAVLDWARATPTRRDVLVAFSGGRDSSVLLHALHAALADSKEWRLAAHHVHHGLSDRADAWAEHCRSMCVNLGVPLSIDRVRVDTHDTRGIEAAARAVRHASLAQAAGDTHLIALAHHARDQAETVLLQLLRGAGPQGLAAMAYGSDHYRVRPLLAVPAAAIAAYATRHALSWVEDESNQDPRFERNRLRHVVWPALIASFPSAERTLARSAKLQSDAARLLANLAAIDLAACSSGVAHGTAAQAPVLVPRLLMLSPERQANALRLWLAENHMGPVGAATLCDWLRQMRTSRATQTLRWSVGGDGASVIVYRDQLQRAWPHDAWPSVPWRGEPSMRLGTSAGNVQFERVAAGCGAGIRAPRLGEHWHIRRRNAGDRIAVSERSGHVSFKNVMQHAGVPPWQRAMWPLLICDNEVVAIAGIAIASAFTVYPRTSQDVAWRVQWKPAWHNALQP